jgi:hypothetical protein
MKKQVVISEKRVEALYREVKRNAAVRASMRNLPSRERRTIMSIVRGAAAIYFGWRSADDSKKHIDPR